MKDRAWRRTPATAGKVARCCLATSHLVYRFGGMKGKGAGRIHPWNRIIIIVSLFLEEPACRLFLARFVAVATAATATSSMAFLRCDEETSGAK